MSRASAPLAGLVLRHLGRRWKGAAALAALMTLRVLLDLLRPWPTKVLVDHALGGKPAPRWLAGMLARLPGPADDPHALVAWCVAGTVAVFLAGWTVAAASTAAGVSFGQRLAYDVGAELFAHLQRLSLRFHQGSTVGDSLRRITTDSAAIATIVRGALVPALTALVTLGLMAAVLWGLSGTLTLVALAAVPPIVVAFRRYARPMSELSYRQEELGGRMYAVVEQSLAALPVVQSFGREAHETERLRSVARETRRASRELVRVQLRFKLLVGAAMAAASAAVLWLGGRQVRAGELTVGGMLVILAYVAALYAPLESLTSTSSTVQGAAGGARRVLEVLRSEPEVRDAPRAFPVAQPQGEVRLERVTFGYEPGRPVLHDVTLAAPRGEVLALVGPTGAGKSTIASLVPRFADPWEGRVTLDGRDLRDLRLADLRRTVAVVPQEPFLFPMSVAENVRYGRPTATRAEIEAAVCAANADEFVARLPRGYDTPLGDRGATLSGGQRQRLALARALLTDPAVLVLDEPTSALDAATEHLLWEALQRLMRGRTTVVIAHRLATVRAADQIAVLDRGRIVQRGRHAELLAAGGLYRELCAAALAGAPDREPAAPSASRGR